MKDYVHWVQSLSEKPIFVAHPLMFDGSWISYYLQNFTNIRFLKGPWAGQILFHSARLCLRTYASAKLNWPLWECQAENYKSEWLGNYEHTHDAIDDARGHAHLLKYLMTV